MSFFQRLYRASIWHPDAIPVLELKYADLKRKLFPVVDICCIYMGLIGLFFGLPSIDTAYGSYVASVGGGVFAACSMGALLGISFPKLWVVEVIGKCVMIGCMVTYGLAVLVTNSWNVENADARLYVLGLIGIAVGLVAFRLGLLRFERTTRHVQAEAEGHGL